MKQRLKSDVLRQNLTRYWKYNIFLQKPYDKGIIFIAILKFFINIEIFITNYRFIHTKTRDINTKRFFKKNVYRLSEINNSTVTNIKFFLRNFKFLFFCNFGLIKEIAPKIINTFKYQNLNFNFTKKLKKLKYKKQIIIKRLFAKNIRISQKNKIIFNKKIYNFYSFYKNKIKLFIFSSKKKYNFLKKKYFKTYIKKMKCLIIKPFRTQIHKPSQQKQYLYKNKRINRAFLPLSKKFFEINKFLSINFLKKYFFWFKIKKDVGIIYDLTMFLKKQIINYDLKIIIKKLYFIKKFSSFLNISNFWYIQLFNKIYSLYFHNFSKTITKNSIKYNIVFQQEFSYPKGFLKLNKFNESLRKATKFLSSNKKFYTNFINIMPLLQTFNEINILAKQFSFELSRTKKHWRVIRGLEAIILQAFVQLKKEPFKGNSNFIGLKFILNGRPNKISRTKKFKFSLGKISKSSFTRFNIFQTYKQSKAQIGAFGISIIASN